MSGTIDRNRQKIQEDALQAIRKSQYNASVLIATGGGKAKILVEAAVELFKGGLAKKIIYTCDNQRLRDIDFPREILKWGFPELLESIEMMCYQSAYKLTGQEYDLWLGDEIDYFLTPAYSQFAVNNIFKYKILCSGTLDSEKRPFLEAIAPIVYEKKTWELEQSGVLNKTKYFKVAYMLSEEENKQYLYFKKQFSDAYRDNKLSYVDFLIKKRKLFLCSLQSSVEVSKRLMAKIYWPKMHLLLFGQSQALVDATLPYTFHTGNQKLNWIEKFNSGEIQALGLIGKANRGTNFLKAPNTVIYQSPTGSSTKLSQQNGRLKRLLAEELAYAFFLVPYYKEIGTNGQIITKPTVVDRWVDESLKGSKVTLEYFQL